MTPTRAQRIAAVEESFDTVPAAQFQSERTLRAALASVERDRARLERELALKDDAITLLRDSLTEAEAELDELRGVLAEREGVAA